MRYTFSDYSNRMIDGQMCIWLQYYGWAPAKPAGEFKPGEFMKWNGGVDEKVIEMTSQTAKMITFKTEYKGYNGAKEPGERKFRKDRMVAFGSGKYY